MAPEPPCSPRPAGFLLGSAQVEDGNPAAGHPAAGTPTAGGPRWSLIAVDLLSSQQQQMVMASLPEQREGLNSESQE